MAQRREVVSKRIVEDFICLQDVLYSFNNSINEEQAWAVCYQCAQFFVQNPTQECFTDLYYYGLNGIRISKEGDLKVEVNFSQGTGKGPPTPGKRSSFSLGKEFKTVITQTDVIQALGTAIYKALDFGLSESEEPHLSPDLEALIELLTDQPADDDEGIDIERDSDADIDQDGQGKGHSVFQDIIDTCERRLSSQQNAQVHYKAVCRALATESTELLTFLDNIARGQEKLSNKDDQPSVDDLERADWARLWVQIMRDLRHGVRLKKVEQVHLPPVEFELTPFEILLEDIRLGRFKLNRIMVNGDIAPKVKDDAHAVILDFIRSRPPLKPAKERKLKDLPARKMDMREQLLHEIRENPVNLKHVEMGKVVVRKPKLDCDTYTSYSSEEEESPKPTRKLIKPIAAFQVSTDDSDSYYSETDEDVYSRQQTPVRTLPASHSQDQLTWKRAVTRDIAKQTSIPHRHVTRRHTISACDNKNGRKVSATTQHVPVLEEEIFDSIEETGSHFNREDASRRLTKAKLVSYRQKHRENVHAKRDCQQTVPAQTCINNKHKSQLKHAGHCVLSKSHGNLVGSSLSVHDDHMHEMSSDENCRLSRSVSVASISEPQRSNSPRSHLGRSQSPHMFGGRSESPARQLSRSETFTCSIPRKTRTCSRHETQIATRCDSPQTRAMKCMDSFPPRCSSPNHSQRTESPRRHSEQRVHASIDIACDNTQTSSEQVQIEPNRRHSSQHVHGRVSHDTHRHIRPVRRHASVASDACLAKSKHDHCNSPNSNHSNSDGTESPRCHSNRSKSEVKMKEYSQEINHSDEIKPEKKKSSVSDLQESQTVTDTKTNTGQVRRSRTSIVRARSRPEVAVRSQQLAIQEEEEKNFHFIESLRRKAETSEPVANVATVSRTVSHRERPVSAIDTARPSRINTAVRANPIGRASTTFKTIENSNDEFVDDRSGKPGSDVQSDRRRREVRLSRQSAIRSDRAEIKEKLQNQSDSDKEPVVKPREPRSRKVAVVARESPVTNESKVSFDVTFDSSINSTATTENVSTRQEVISSKQEVTSSVESDRSTHRHAFRQVRPIIRSRSEVRPRPVKGSHNLPVDLENNNLDDSVDKLVIIPPPEFRDPIDSDSSPEKVDSDSTPNGDIDHSIGDIPDVIKTSKAEFKVADLLHVSWKCETIPPEDSSPTNTSNPCTDFRIPASHKWQNPIECLSLTLEEVTHIRSVLTKAELESLITKPELYTQVSKGKVCFTCKKTQFKLFGQWGTKCKFCQRTVCNYCLRKMNVPTEHFEKIPVYTLSPVPLSPEVLEALKVYESTGSVPHSPNLDRKAGDADSKTEEQTSPVADDTKLATRRKSLQRSHTIGVGVGSRPPPNRALLRGPQMSICCDCKSMIMEIIRASRSSVSFLSGKTATPTEDDKDTIPLKAPPQSSKAVTMRPRKLDIENRSRPRSMLASLNFKSLNLSSKFGSEA